MRSDEPKTPWVERRRWQRTATAVEDSSKLAPPAIEPLRFNTDNLPVSEQFEAWRTHLSDVLDVRLPDGVTSEQGFPAEHVTWHFGGGTSHAGNRTRIQLFA